MSFRSPAASRRFRGAVAAALFPFAAVAVPAAQQEPAPAPAPEPAALVPLDGAAEAYRLFAEGRLAEWSRDPEAAAAAYRRAAELDGEASDPLVALARIYLSGALRGEPGADPEAGERAAREAAERDPEAPAPHRILGDHYFRQLRAGGDPEAVERAIAAYSEAVRLAPEDLDSRSALARLLASARRGEEAAEHFRELVRRAPDAYEELTMLARLRLAAGDREQAFDFLLRSLRIEPRQPDARELLDDLLLGPEIPGRTPAEAFAEAAALYGTATADHPEDPELRVAHAEALARAGRLGDAGEAFERALEADPDNEFSLMGLAVVRRRQQRLEEAEEVLGRVLEKNARHLPARDALGGVFLARCEYRRAADEFRALLDLPEDAYGIARRRDFLVRFAHARQELGDHRAALDALREAAALSEGRSDALRFEVMRVHGALAAGETAEADRLLAAVRDSHPENPGLEALRARVLAESGRPAEALALLRALVESHPGEPGMIHELLRHRIEQGDYAEAERMLRERLSARPGDLPFRFQLAAVLERQGRPAEAEAEFRAILERDPEHALSLNYLGYMLTEEDDRLPESEDLIRRALEVDPYNGSYRDSLGWVQFRRGRLDLAEPNLLRAVRCMPENSVVLDHLGDLYRAKGDAEAAVRFWRRALEHDGEEELERDAVSRKIEEVGDEPDPPGPLF